jgi:hypothetical protein
MNNFKSGSGNLNFGDEDEDEENDEADRNTAEPEVKQDEPTVEERPSTVQSDGPPSDSGNVPEHQISDRKAIDSAESGTSAGDYPYFVRRSNVGDERDTRLEIHVRDKVANQEAEFRNELAEQLGANEVSKTDAREFALLAAFQYPDRVAGLMEKEGFGTLG